VVPMTSYGSRKDPFSLKNGWMNFEDLVHGLSRSVQSAQQKLAETADSGLHLVIKDIKLDIPMEVHHDAGTSETRVRLPSLALHLNGNVNDQHLSRFQFSFGHAVKHSE